MNEEIKNNKMNILVVGTSGAGKSTLIAAVAGNEKKSNFGEGDTQNIEVSESNIWPLRFIDTKGFEYGWHARRETLSQIKKYTKEQLAGTASTDGIDAIWYCIDGTGKRIFDANNKLFRKIIKNWKNTPIFIVITKSYSKPEADENINEIKQLIESNKTLNIKGTFPVVSKAYIISDDISDPYIVQPRGVAELCESTLACSSEAVKIKKENINHMILEQKRKNANAFVGLCTTAGGFVGSMPLSFSDALILAPLEVGMTKHLLKIYGIKEVPGLVTAIVGSAAITNAAKAVLAQLKNIPSLYSMIATGALNAVVAGTIIEVLGQCIIALCEAICIGRINPEKLDDVKDFLSENLLKNGKIKKLIDSVGDKAGKHSK